jgi:hypothetical protein
MSFGDTFLAAPDLFPARQAGETWGSEAVELAIPGGPYLCSGLDPRQVTVARAHFGSFVKEPTAREPAATEGAEVRFYRVAPGEFLSFDLRGWEYSLDFDYQPSAVRLAGLGFMGRLDWRPGLTGAVWTPEAGTDRFTEIFENFLRVMTAYRLLEMGGVMLHSAGVESGGRAWIFFGRSGAGKTTLSRKSLFSGRRVLSDDINAVRPHPEGDSGRMVVERMPFAGDLGRTGEPGEAFPLAGLFRLEKSRGPTETSVDLRPLGPAAAVAALAACAPFVNLDPHREEVLSRRLESLVEEVPCRILSSSLDGDVWALLEGDPSGREREGSTPP